MIAEERFRQLQDFIGGYSREELIWLNGYLSGLVSGTTTDAGVPSTAASAPVGDKKKITLAFGTETGNAKRLAMQLGAVARQKGVQAKLAGLDQYRLSDLSKEEYFIIIISTQGEGEPPIPAKEVLRLYPRTKPPTSQSEVCGSGIGRYVLSAVL
ncbi:MAG: flavodoxin domain-containing protein [Chitinophagaceae bacterium]|nr:flavodoxin domain-containing protein [Chitinophagaceae bacterium]